MKRFKKQIEPRKKKHHQKQGLAGKNRINKPPKETKEAVLTMNHADFKEEYNPKMEIELQNKKDLTNKNQPTKMDLEQLRMTFFRNKNGEGLQIDTANVTKIDGEDRSSYNRDFNSSMIPKFSQWLPPR